MVGLARQREHGGGADRGTESRLAGREGYEFKTRWWNLNTVSSYLRNSARTLINYFARNRKGMPVSNSIAESAVNQAVTCRMPKKREMPWTHEEEYCMAKVRASVLNGEFSSHRILAIKITDSR